MMLLDGMNPQTQQKQQKDFFEFGKNKQYICIYGYNQQEKTQMNKQKLVRFINKYYLNGIADSVVLKSDLNKAEPMHAKSNKFFSSQSILAPRSRTTFILF